MCGIAGYFTRKPVSHEAVTHTLKRMRNRGPDHRAHKIFKAGDCEVGFLHSRLSIIDLDERAHQPMSIGPCTLIFNGEIYNYVELKKDLARKGVHFATESDTEVLLQSYLEYGESCVEKFEGMWAFAVFDTRTSSMFLSRDRFGEKPLYFLENNGGFYFGSEVKFIQALSDERLKVNNPQLLRYLVNGYKSLYKKGETFFENVQELPHASSLTIGKDFGKHQRRYWCLKVEPRVMSFQEAVDGVRERLINSMKIRLRADVPLAFCLSGGVDSAALASIAAKEFKYDVATFSIIDGDERYNEFKNIRSTVDDLKCRHTFIELKPDRTLEKLKDLIAYHDGPVATISYLVHSFLSQMIAGHGYKVAFSGTAADELFTGYYDHFILHLHEMRNRPDYSRYLDDWRSNVSGFVRNPSLKDPDYYAVDPGRRDHVFGDTQRFSSYLKVPFVENFSEENYSGSLLKNRMANELFGEVIPVILHEDDLNSMKYSVENRSPYLDTALTEFAYSIPNEHLIGRGYSKYVLREAVKGILNDTVRLDRKKVGFNASIHSVIDFHDPDECESLLNDSPIFDIVERSKIAGLMKEAPLSDSMNKFFFSFVNAKIFLELNS